MNNLTQKILAEAIRVEYNNENNQVFVVFEIIDEELKKEIRSDWTKDLEFKLIGRTLIKE